MSWQDWLNPADWQAQLGALNWLDWVVLLLLLLSAIEGTRRGFLLGALDLLTALIALGVAFVAERPTADLMLAAVPRLAPPLAHLAAFLGLLLVVQFAIGAILGRLVHGAVRVLSFTPFGVLDRLLGAAPGLVRGVVLVTLFLLPLALLPIFPPVSQAVESSSVANRLVGGAMQVLPTLEGRLGQDLEGGLPSLVVAPPEAEETARPLPAPVTGDLQADPAAEQRMLELVNQERTSAGLRPLAADERLRQVARAHSLEMFQLDYFSHTSPTSGSPFDRMRAAGIPFLVAGENLAYAPDVEIAHRGLMNSPGHRANILRAEFGRVGIGVIRSPLQGSMFTQEFTN